MSESFHSIKDRYMEEVKFIAEGLELSNSQLDIVNKVANMVFDKGYQVGIESGWAFEQERLNNINEVK